MRRMVIPAAIGLMTLAAIGGRAHAYEATRTGLSVGAGIEGFVDGTVTETDGTPMRAQGGQLGATVLGNIGDAALGIAVSGRPDIVGNGRLMLGGRAGWQPTFGSTRVQILGDAGIHQFTHIKESFFDSSSPEVITTPYLGFQVGMTRSFFRDGHLEYGLALQVRHDLRQQTITQVHGGLDIFGTSDPVPPSQLQVGGTMAGLSLTIGFRIEKPQERRQGNND